MKASTGSSRRTADSAHAVLRAFRLVFGTAKRHFHQVNAVCGIGGSELWALTEISRHPGLRVSGVAATLLVHQSTASNLVEALNGQRLITKRRSKTDQRVVHLFVTARGVRLLARAPAPTDGVLPDAIRRLSGPDLRKLNAGIHALVKAMALRDKAAAAIPLSEI